MGKLVKHWEDRDLMIGAVQEVLELIKTGWCQDACALTKAGNVTKYSGKDAARFSLYGAIHRVDALHGFDRVPGNNISGLMTIIRIRGEISEVVSFNDSARCTQESVVKLLERVIRSLQNDPKARRAAASASAEV